MATAWLGRRVLLAKSTSVGGSSPARHRLNSGLLGGLKMTILEAMQKTIDGAKSSGKLCYLYENEAGYFLSYQYRHNWLFRVYPGGRKELSTYGNKLVQEEIRPTSGSS